MKAAVFLTGKRFEIQERPVPVPGEGEVLIRNMVCGICGTDVHIYHGEAGSAQVSPPIVLGHEYAGVVEALGPGVTGLRPGDRVTVDPNIYCGCCRPCRSGEKQLCEAMEAVGVTRDGGFAEYSAVPATQALLLEPALDLAAASMAEPLACCIHGMDLAGVKSGDVVLIVGGGAIGLLMAQLAWLAGAARVVVSEPVEARRGVALALGIDGALDPGAGDLAEQLEALTGRRGADVVVECVGRPAAVNQAFQLADKGATVVLFSVPAPEAVYELPLFDVYKKELTIRGSFVNPDTQERAVELLSTGRIQTAPLITHRFALSEVEKAIRMQGGAESIKVVLDLISQEGKGI